MMGKKVKQYKYLFKYNNLINLNLIHVHMYAL